MPWPTEQNMKQGDKRCRVLGTGYRVQGAGYRVQGLILHIAG